MSTPSHCLKVTQYTLMASMIIWPHSHPQIHVHINTHTQCTYFVYLKKNPIF